MRSPNTKQVCLAVTGSAAPLAISSNTHETDEDLRDTGIPPIGQIPWGAHVCLFCETKQDILDAALAYFAPSAQEYCIWVVSPPVSVDEALEALSSAIPGFAARRAAGGFDVVSAREWYYINDSFDVDLVIAAWHARADWALKRGYAGVRAYGNPLWRDITGWRRIGQFDRAVETTLSNRRIVMLCSLALENSLPQDVLDIASNHHCVVIRRSGQWQLLEIAGAAHRETNVLSGDLGILPGHLAQGAILTERERVVLAQLLHGASSKTTARLLGISPRTVDFHRANMMAKLGARNTAELIGKVLAGDP